MTNIPNPLGHLYIGICSNRSGPVWELAKSLEYATVELFSRGWHVSKGRAGSSDIEDGRNQLFTYFVNNPTYTHALFVDDDVHWDGDAVWRLVNHPVDFVLGAYPKRADGEGFPISMLDEPIQFVDPATGEPDDKDGLLKIAGGPGGMMRITRACAEKMIKAYPDDWYHQPVVPTTKKAWNMFEFTVKNHIRRSEDKHFCLRWRDIGGDVWCDPHLAMHHVGDKTYSGCFAHYLRHTGLKQPGKVVKVDLVGGPEAKPNGAHNVVSMVR